MEHSAETKKRRIFASLYEAFRRANDAVFYTDAAGVILEVNDAFTRVYGYTAKEAVGGTPRLLRSSHSTKDMYEKMWSSILDPRRGYWRGELINRAKDGREIPILLTITAVRDTDGQILGYVSNGLDMSEQMQLQSRLAQSEALANLGEMAAVVAHEIRNPLGSIVMAARQLGSDDLPNEDKETVLRVLRSESQRLNAVLTNFLAYARPRGLQLSRGDLNALAREVCGMAKSNPALIGNVSIRLKFDKGLEPFPMDADQLRQVLWNIVLNGIQAMEGRGIMTVSTGRTHGDAWIRIHDSGPGIAEESVGQIFKPFHTTKQQGTGLGLAIADRIVKAHGGRITIESELGKGAAFVVSLPAAQE